MSNRPQREAAKKEEGFYQELCTERNCDCCKSIHSDVDDQTVYFTTTDASSVDSKQSGTGSVSSRGSSFYSSSDSYTTRRHKDDFILDKGYYTLPQSRREQILNYLTRGDVRDEECPVNYTPPFCPLQELQVVEDGKTNFTTQASTLPDLATSHEQQPQSKSF